MVESENWEGREEHNQHCDTESHFPTFDLCRWIVGNSLHLCRWIDGGCGSVGTSGGGGDRRYLLVILALAVMFFCVCCQDCHTCMQAHFMFWNKPVFLCCFLLMPQYTQHKLSFSPYHTHLHTPSQHNALCIQRVLQVTG